MINREVVKQFLEQPRDDFTWIKQVPSKELHQAIFEICPEYQFPKGIDLFQHQLAAIYLSLCIPNFMFYLWMGSGKTLASLISLDIQVRYLKRATHAIIVVPNAVNVQNWINEIKKYTQLSAIPLLGSIKQRELLLKEPSTIKIINYDGLGVLMGGRTIVNNKQKLVIDVGRTERVRNLFDFLILDEIQHTKHPTSMKYKFCNLLAQKIPYRIGMSGTPIGRNSEGFWSQFFIIDRGESLGKSQALFHQALFKARYNGFGSEYFLPEESKKVLHRLIKHRSIHYEESECSDLPPLVNTIVDVPFPESTLKMYKQLMSEVLQNKIEDYELNRKLNFYMKARQLASGFIYEEIEGKRKALRFKEQPKLLILEELLQEVPDSSKIAIFYLFQESGHAIVNLLKKMKMRHIYLTEGSDKTKMQQLLRFQTDPSVRTLVVNTMSGSEGLNLQVANYQIMFEPIDRPDKHSQAIKRLHRTGQRASCVHLYEMITIDSVETKIKGFLNEGKSLSRAILNGEFDLKDLI